VTPEEIDRALARDAVGVRASPRFVAAVMAAVRSEVKAPPPIPFPWTRAAPLVAAAVLTLAVAVWSLLSSSGAETAAVISPSVERAVAITAQLSNGLAAWDARWALIWAVVAAFTVIPILAPLLLVSVERSAPARSADRAP
jgi:hypothetical protein